MAASVLADELLAAQVKRAIMAKAAGAADRGECLAIAERIGRVDLDRRQDEWRAAAVGAIANGERLLAAEDRDGAGAWPSRMAKPSASNWTKG